MTRFLLALLLAALSASSIAQTLNYATEVNLTGDNVLTPESALWAAFKLDPRADRIERAKAYMEVREQQRYASNMHDEPALLAEARIKADEIDAKLKTMPGRLRYRLEIPALMTEVDGQKVRISTAFNSGLYSFPTDFGINNTYFPPLYEFIIANADRFQWFEVPQGRAAEVQELLRTQGPQTAYIRVELELVSLQQHRRFQTVIRQIDWYADYARQRLVANVVDKRKAKSLISKRMFSEGATFEIVPEHAFLIAGERILETLAENTLGPKRECREGKREHGHRVYECSELRDFINGIPVRADYRYVGGRLVAVYQTLQAGAQVSDQKLDEAWQVARREHQGPPALVQGTNRWNFGAARFVFERDIFMAGDTSKPFYLVEAIAYDGLKQGKPGTEVLP